jgi:mycothiol synthase
MSSSLPEGFTLRGAQWEDAEAAATLVASDDRAVRGEAQWDVDDQRDWWSQLDLERNAWLVENRGGLVATGSLLQRGEKLDGWISIDPKFKRRGLATALVRIVEERARELGGQAVRLGAFGENTDGRLLLESLGYRDVRHHYEMRIDLETPPPEPKWPVGLRVVPFELTDARGVHAAINDAFAGEWNFHARSFEEWRALRLDAPTFDATLWFVVKDGDEIAGFVCCSAKQFGGPWIALIGVRSPWRRRGLGLALLHQAFGEFYRRGERAVALGVDADNSTGATRLYERAGMRVHAEDVTYQKELT